MPLRPGNAPPTTATRCHPPPAKLKPKPTHLLQLGGPGHHRNGAQVVVVHHVAGWHRVLQYQHAVQLLNRSRVVYNVARETAAAGAAAAAVATAAVAQQHAPSTTHTGPPTWPPYLCDCVIQGDRRGAAHRHVAREPIQVVHHQIFGVLQHRWHGQAAQMPRRSGITGASGEAVQSKNVRNQQQINEAWGTPPGHRPPVAAEQSTARKSEMQCIDCFVTSSRCSTKRTQACQRTRMVTSRARLCPRRRRCGGCANGSAACGPRAQLHPVPCPPHPLPRPAPNSRLAAPSPASRTRGRGWHAGWRCGSGLSLRRRPVSQLLCVRLWGTPATARTASSGRRPTGPPPTGRHRTAAPQRSACSRGSRGGTGTCARAAC